MKLLMGDCLELMKEISTGSIDMICSDLPYGQTARNRWDVLIPFSDYLTVSIKNKSKTMNQNQFLLWCYQNGESDYQEALRYFNENKSIGLWTHYNRIIKDNGVIVLFANGMFTADMMNSNRAMWKYNLIWEKTQPTGFQNANRMPMRNHEDMCVFYKKQATYNPQKTSGHIRKVSTAAHKSNSKQSTNYNEIKNHSYDSTERFPKSVWLFAKDSQKSKYHPTQKSLKLIEELIKTYSNKGDLILDSCMGSGTTGVGCIHLQRDFIGIEQDEIFFQVAKQRIMDEKKKTL